MPTLLIRHTGDDPETYRFRVERLADGRRGEDVAITAPDAIQVEGRPDSALSQDLRWYLEEFLGYPFDPNTDVARRVQDALQAWGQQAFTALFQGNALLWYADAYREKLENLTLKIASDHPHILAWPWEALHDPQSGTLAHACRIERQLDALYDPLPLSEKLPRERINILLVTARPYDADVGFRALSRPLLELITEEQLPATLDVLRPPTFEQLRAHLHAKPDHYHIVHFDGHGGYGRMPSAPGGHQFREGKQGLLVFEDDDGNAKLIDATQLGTLLREHRIPIMVLNACQSAMLDDAAEDAFASVAGALQKAGINAVVAMAYALYVSGAEVFIPAFYRRLFERGSVSEAVRAGRQAMLEKRERVCARGTFPLDDWLVPVVYQQDPPELNFAATAAPPATADTTLLPEEITADANPYGFIGRDSALLALERAWQRQPAGILIHGLGGIGKTTLAKGFVHWLAETGGLADGCFWFAFNDIRSSEHVFNQLVGALFGTNAIAAPLDEKIEALVQTCKDRPLVIVWDNFESVCGIPDTDVQPLLPAPDRGRLQDFLYRLRGGKTKILITSRSQETAWLNRPNCFRLALGGLRGEERWAYCNAIVRDLGLTVDREDPELSELMALLDGHPLMMRVMLVQLADVSARELAARLRDRLPQTDADESQAKLFATLGFVEAALPDDLKPLLTPLALHERFVDAAVLEAMANTADPQQSRAVIDRFLTGLETAGLLHPHGQGVYALHPALSGFLRSWTAAATADEDRWRRVFVEIMGGLADRYAAKELHEQRPVFTLYGASFHTALAAAEQLAMDDDFAALTQALAAYAQNQRDFAGAQRYFETLAAHSRQRSHHEGEAAAYHELGRIAEEQRDFAAAEQWYRKALAIKERQGNEHGAASTYHQLGRIAEEQRDFAAAEQWYRKALAIKERQGNEHGAASTYHQLGRIAEKQRDFAAAEQWYRKALAIAERQGNEHGAALTYHQLGRIAEKQRDFAAAEQWYRKALAIEERQGNEHGAAFTYGQLGLLAHAQAHHVEAGRWLLKALQGFARSNAPHLVQQTAQNFLIIYKAAPSTDQTTLKTLWKDAGLGPFPGDDTP